MLFKEAMEKIGYDKEYIVIDETDRLVCVFFRETVHAIVGNAARTLFPLFDNLIQDGFIFTAIVSNANYWYFRKEEKRIVPQTIIVEKVSEITIADSTQGMRRGE